MANRLLIHACAALAILLLAPVQPAFALINPTVQPRNLYDLYEHVFSATVTKVESKELVIELAVDGRAKGAIGHEQITLAAPSRDLLEQVLSVQKGQKVVVFAGRARPRSRMRDVLYYLGGGVWHKAQMAAEAPLNRWELQGSADEGVDRGSVDIMFGVFNGQVAQLWSMLEDLKNDRAYFPAVPFARYEERRIDALPGPAGGVALHDLDKDGRLDLVVTSQSGCRVYVQSATGEFQDRTKEAGIGEVKARSVSIADANADGTPDLLLDGVLYRGQGVAWTRTPLLPDLGKVLTASFVELDGDGYPDVIASLEGGGLRVFTNSAKGGEALTEVTATLPPLQGTGGYFEVGDWNGDGRTDIMYLAGPGYLLLNQPDGFKVTTLSAEDESPEYGTAAMAPLVDPARNAALVLADDSKRLLENRDGDIADITKYGNEIQDDITGLRMVLIEDLGAHGRLDIFAFSGAPETPSFFCVNRGYGSFMLPEKYTPGLVPSAVYNGLGVSGAAAGDVTGDGANDILLGGVDGSVRLLVNRTLDDRPQQPEANTLADERKRIAARLLTIAPQGATGVLGAWVKLWEEGGRLAAAGQIGGNVGTGCSSPHQVTLAVRESGKYRLEVRYSDGKVHEEALELGHDTPRHQTLRPGAAR